MADFVEKLIIDDSEAIAPLKGLQREMSETVKGFKKMQDEINADQKKMADQVKQGQDAIAQALQKSQEQQRKTGDVFKTATKESGSALKNFIDKGLAVYGTSIDDLGAKYKRLKENFGAGFKLGIAGGDRESIGALTDKMGLFGKVITRIGVLSGGMGKMFVSAMRMMAAGIAATGIGALILAVVSLITFFGKTEKGAMLVQRAMGAIGVVANVLTDAFADLGEKLFAAFSNPKQAVIDLWEAIKTNLINRIKGIPILFQALGKVISSGFKLDWKGLKEGASDVGGAVVQLTTGFDEAQRTGIKEYIKDLGSEIKASVGLNDQLIQREQALAKAMSGAAKGMAEQERALAVLNAQLDDSDTKAADRLKLIDRISDIEQGILATKIKFAREEFDIIKRRSQLPGFENLKEDVARKEIELYGLITEAKTKDLQATAKLKAELKSQAKVFEDTANTLFNLAKTYGGVNEFDEFRQQMSDATKTLEEQRKKLLETADSIDTNRAAWEGLYGKDAVETMRQNIGTQIELLEKVGEALKKQPKPEVLVLEQQIKKDKPGLKELEKTLDEMQRLINEQENLLLKATDDKTRTAIQGTISKLKREFKILRESQYNETLESLKKQLDLALQIQASNPQIDMSGLITKLESAIIQELKKEEGKVYSLNPSVVVTPDVTQTEGKKKKRSISDDVSEYLEDIDTAEQLFDKVGGDLFKKLFPEGDWEDGKEFIKGLGSFVQSWGAILNEADAIRIGNIDKMLDKLGEKRAKLEDELNHELELQREGLANNVGNKQKEVDGIIAEEERLRAEREKIQKAAERRQILSDTAQQASSLITASIDIIKGFAHIPFVGLPLGIAAVAALFTFFAKTKIEALKATRLYTGADKISDHFGYARRHGETDLPGRGSGYRLYDEKRGTPTDVIISGREMLIPEAVSLEHEAFFHKMKLGMYRGIDLNAALNFYKNFQLTPSQITVMQPNVQVNNIMPQRQFIPVGDGKWSLVTISKEMKDGTIIEVR